MILIRRCLDLLLVSRTRQWKRRRQLITKLFLVSGCPFSVIDSISSLCLCLWLTMKPTVDKRGKMLRFDLVTK